MVQRAVDAVEVLTGLHEAWRGGQIQIRAERDDRRSDSNAPASVSTRLAIGSIDRTTVWTNLTPGLTMSRYG